MATATYRIPKLSKREIECLMWAARDKTIKETSELMALSPRTIKSYRFNVMIKVRKKSIAGTICYAMKNHLIEV